MSDGIEEFFAALAIVGDSDNGDKDIDGERCSGCGEDADDEHFDGEIVDEQFVDEDIDDEYCVGEDNGTDDGGKVSVDKDDEGEAIDDDEETDCQDDGNNFEVVSDKQQVTSSD